MARITTIQIPPAETVEELRHVLTSVINGLIDQINNQTITSTQDAGNNRISNVASPAQATDAATKGYVDGAVSQLLRATRSR